MIRAGLITLALATLSPLYEDQITVDAYLTFPQAMEGSTAPQEIVGQLEMVEVEYYGFDDALHRGQIIVHRELAADVREIFGELKRMRFPIEMVIPPRFDLPGGGTTMDTLNNTMGFHYRTISTFETTQLSYHAYGRAIDINPFQNPAVLRSGAIIPEGAAYDPAAKGTITADSPVVRLFRRYGWQWGGRWRSLKDYMHFEKPR